MIEIHSSSNFIKVNVSNSRNDNVAFEKKFPKDMTVAELKSKLEIITGGCAGSMELEIYKGDKLVVKLSDNDKMIGSYPIDDGMRLHVVDNYLFIADNVEKFELSDQQYDQKSDSVRNFLKKNRLGKYNEEEMRQLEEKKRQVIEEEKQKAALCTIGSRCQVTSKGLPPRRGTVMYNGELEGKKGIFIGIKYDEPLGKNDGSLNGKRYFDCQPNYGGFVIPSAVEVDDFPPLEDDLDDEF